MARACIVGWAHPPFGKRDEPDAETHDCFAIAELIEDEVIGQTAREGFRMVREGRAEKGWNLPVNPCADLKSKGHPAGATGVSMHVMACLPLMNVVGGMQIHDVQPGGVFSMGGAAVANYVSILERRI